MINKKIIFKTCIWLVLTSIIGISGFAEIETAYAGEYIDFEDGVSDWSFQQGVDEAITIGVVDEEHGNSVSMVTSGTLTTYKKKLNMPIKADNSVYVLSYDLFIPKITTETTKQTVAVIGRASNTVPAFYSLRIDNGVVSYYNGNDKYSVSTAYKNGEKLTITENEWHNIKTVYNRITDVFTYYIDNEPLLTEKGDIIRIKPLELIKRENVTEFNLMMRSAKGYEFYVDNISVYESNNPEEKTGVRVYDFALLSESGEEVSDISNIEKLVVNAEYEAYEDFIPIVALYKGEALKNVYHGAVDVSEDGCVSTFSFDINNSDGANNAKFFVWNNFETLIPYKFLKKADNTEEISICLDSASVQNDELSAERTQKDLSAATMMNDGFGQGSKNWIRTSDAGEMTTANIDDRHGTSITINSDHTDMAVFKKEIPSSLKADNKAYSLSYSVFIPDVKNSSPSQSVCVTGQTSDGTDSFLSLKIDNGVISYFDGKALFTTTDGYDENGNKLTVTPNKWQVLKTVYDRMSGEFTYFFNNKPVYDADGNIVRVHTFNNLLDDEITHASISVRNTDDSDTIYIDNLAISECEILTDVKDGVAGVVLKAPIMDYNAETAKKKKYDSAFGGPVEICYINFTVNDKTFKNRRDGMTYEIEVSYFDEGYGVFTLEYDTYYETLKEAEYVELQNTKEWKTYTFLLEEPYFTGENVDFRLASWAEKMRYSNSDILISNVVLKNHFDRNQYEIENVGSSVGNIYYTGETQSFTTTISNKNYHEYSNSFGTYDAVLRYSILDENKNIIEVVSEKMISISPISVATENISFNVDKYGLYYLKTEVICDKYSLYGVDETEFSYVNSDKVTVNPDFGTSAQVAIFSDDVSGEEVLAKNAGIGMVRWVRGMSDVMTLTYDNSSQTLTEKGFGAWKPYEKIFKDNGYTVLNCLLAGNMIYSDQTKNGYKLHIPYDETGRDLFARYCRYFAENAPEETKYYEIWNEFDSPAGAKYNMNGEDYSNYGNLLVKAADEIYDVDPDAEIISVVSSHVNTHKKAIQRVKSLVGEENAQKYFKNASVHPYHWNDNPLYCESTVYGTMTNMYKHMKEIRDAYDEAGLTDTKLWVTEIAWSPHFTDYNDVRNFPDNVNLYDKSENAFRKPITEKQQGSYLVQTYVMMKKDNLIEKYVPYLFARQTDVRVDRDKNMGIIKSYNPSYAKVPYAATSAYLAVANLNMLMTGAEYVDDFAFSGGNSLAYRYKKADGNDIAILWSALEEGESVSLNLGCSEVTVYDEYGNSEKRRSTNGVYEFNLTQSTVYVEGIFGKFSK